MLEQCVGLLGFSVDQGNIFQGTRQHWLIFQENNGINLILGDRNVAIWKTPRSVSMHWPYAFIISVGNCSVLMLY